jgi:hypothetical protein
MRGDLISRVLAEAGKVVQSRSSVLVPLHWKIAILGTFLLVALVVKAPAWAEVGLFSLLALAVLQSSFSYNYFMRKDPDALRSEKHALSKYAIDKGLYGDSDVGMRELPKVGNEFLLPSHLEPDLMSKSSKGRKR